MEKNTLKNPITATSLDSTSSSAAATSARVVAAGPVRFFNQFRMSSASLPARLEEKLTYQALYFLLSLKTK